MTDDLPSVKVAVVGHTNTGKTSLMRTLIRDAGFGEVDDGPATTRHVEGAVLLVANAPRIELFDTPGLEDSISLLECLDELRTERRTPWVEVVRAFLESDAGRQRFEQEAKAIRQVLESDAVLYVVDARDRVLAKYRDELEILGRCARPVVPVLNFTAKPDALAADWRAQLSEVGMHAVVAFDTVALDEGAERRLFEALMALLEPFRPTLHALIRERAAQWRATVRGAAELVADLLLDAAAFTVSVGEGAMTIDEAVEALRGSVRAREQQCVDSLLVLFQFRAEDCDADALPIASGQWGLDLFSPDSLRRFGVRASSGAAVGGLAGLTVDAMTGGLSLGAAAALGATAGALWSTADSHGRRIVDLVRGASELRVRQETLRLLAVRQISLVQALLHRGHASQERVRLAEAAQGKLDRWAGGALPRALREARFHPEWSRLGGGDAAAAEADSRRAAARNQLAREIAGSFAPDWDP